VLCKIEFLSVCNKELKFTIDALVFFCLTVIGNNHILPGSVSKVFDNIKVSVYFLLSKVTNLPYQALIVGKDDDLDSFSCSKPTAK